MSARTREKLSDDDRAAWIEFTGGAGQELNESTPSTQDLEDWSDWLGKDHGTDTRSLEPASRSRHTPNLNPAKRKSPGSGLTRTEKRQLQSGRMEPECMIDLHGMNRDEADSRISSFLHEQRMKRARLVLIITGKGLRSQGSYGVLNSRVAELLSNKPLSGLVSYFSHAHGKHGGNGAYYVVLKRS